MGGLQERDRRDGGGGFNETREAAAAAAAAREGGRERREAPAFPSEPPYVAFVGNFPFDASKEDVLATCAVEDASIVRVRPMTDRTQTRVRGYFVEVADAETLREMLKADGVAVGDRPLRVNVAEERRSSLDKGRRHSHDRGQRRNSNQNQRTAGIGAAVGDNIVEPAAERKKLVLKPRSVEADSGDSAFAGSSSIFGGAKPVDTTKVLEEVERKIDAELHREPIKVPTPKEKRKTPPTLKVHDEPVAVEDSNVFSLLSIEDDE